MTKYYYIFKTAVYDHGVFWIGEDIDVGKSKLIDFARCDCDSHHSWFLVCFKNPIEYKEITYPEGKHCEDYEIISEMRKRDVKI